MNINRKSKPVKPQLPWYHMPFPILVVHEVGTDVYAIKEKTTIGYIGVDLSLFKTFTINNGHRDLYKTYDGILDLSN